MAILLNTALAGWGLGLFFVGLFLVMPLFLFSYESGLLICMVSGLVYDAVMPGQSFGMSLVIFGVVFTVAHVVRTEFKTYSRWHTYIYIHAVNTVLYITYSIVLGGGLFSQWAYWGSLFLNWVVSQGVIVLLSPWLLDMLFSLEYFFGVNTEHTNEELA